MKTYILGDNKINGITINEKIRDEELHEYYIIDRKDFIDELINWISEANKDKELMKSDLKMLLDIDDDFIFTSNSTNSYIHSNSVNFVEVCEELLKLNKIIL